LDSKAAAGKMLLKFLAPDHSLSDAAQGLGLDAQVGRKMVERDGIEDIRMLPHHFHIPLFCRFEQEAFGVGHQLVEGILGYISAESFPLVGSLVQLLQIVDVDVKYK